MFHFMANFVNTRKNFPDAQKLSGRQCRRADEVFGTLPPSRTVGSKKPNGKKLTERGGTPPPEAEKPRRHVGIADRKVFARPESFCAYVQNLP